MKLKCLLLLLLFISISSWARGNNTSRKYNKEQLWADEIQRFIHYAAQDTMLFTPLPQTKLDTIYKKRGINIHFSEEFAYNTLRPNDVDTIYSILKERFGVRKGKKMQIYVDDLPLEQYIPNYYLDKKDKKRIASPYDGAMNVTHISKPYNVGSGMAQRHIALWNSHGYYYSHKVDKWLYQRAPLFTTVEDLFTSTYVLKYLVPMLENAGANVYLPRERDIQTNEFIIDNEDEEFSVKGQFNINNIGLKNDVKLNSPTINPFKLGDNIVFNKGSQASWDIQVSESGEYAVYVTYVTMKNSSANAHYIVTHSGGVTDFIVNQQMGGGTWIYLGTFHFNKGEKANVILQNTGEGAVSADAVRLGGGMGSIVRGGKISGVPRWQEAARYYLQYSGAADTLTFNLHSDENDYNDDFRSRARWVNYLLGGKNIEKKLIGDAHCDGLGLPIDMCFGFHTDAGHFHSMDTTIGTLMIYSTYDVAQNREFNNGKSRLLNRDIADLVQDQIVNDVRTLYHKDWNKRELWDKMYSEATFAQVPSFLLELLSHGNALDMRYGLDPNFQFDVSRAIYKAMLKFLSTYYQEDYTVQPLPVSCFRMDKSEGKTMLKWKATTDKLEPTATPNSYVVYKRKNGYGWDNGTLVDDNFYEIKSDTGVYSYKITAINDGGESFPSTILSTAFVSDSAPTVLVVDGFSRVAAPFFIESGDSVGVAPWLDEGVSYGLDISTIGWQYEYNQNLPWVSDTLPGHGGSSFELANTTFVGNNFDHSRVHAKAFYDLGYNVVSSQMSAVEADFVKLSDYYLVDISFGEQRSDVYPLGEIKNAIFTSEMMSEVRGYLQLPNAKLIISGAHIATDAYVDTTYAVLNSRMSFVKNTLGYDSGGLMQENHFFLNNDTIMFSYNKDYSQTQYRVENTDVLIPEDGAKVVSNYSNNDVSAVFYFKTLSSAVPFESIKTEAGRKSLLAYWLKLFEN